MQTRTARRSKQSQNKTPLRKRKVALRRINVGFVTAFLLLVSALLWFGLLLPGSAPALSPAAARGVQHPPDMAVLQKELAYADIPRPANPLVSLIRSDGYSDADAQRMTAQVTPASAATPGVTTHYVYDGQNMVREMQPGADGQLHPTATYLTGPRGPEYRRDDKTGQVRWYVYDGLGSVVGELDPSGNFTTSAKYDMYGAVRGRTGTATTAHGFVGSLGHLSEPETGLIYMRARYYDPTLGRFINEDPAQDGKNWFSYVNNNPITGRDFSGEIAGEDDEDAADGEAYLSITEKIERIFGQSAKSFKSNSRAKNYLRDILKKRGDDISDEQAGRILEDSKDGLDLGGADNVRIGKDGSIFTPNNKWLGDALDFL